MKKQALGIQLHTVQFQRMKHNIGGKSSTQKKSIIYDSIYMTLKNKETVVL